jgi:hypothetical protein
MRLPTTLERKGAGMVHTTHKKSRIPVKIIMPLTLFMIVGCVLVAGCSIPSIRNTKIENSSSPAITPSIDATTPAVMQTTVPNPTETSTELKKGQLDVSVGDYPAELPVFVDEVNVGNVSRDKPLNLTTGVGRHTVRICVIGSCVQEDVLVISSETTTIDFGERLKKEVVSGPLRVSIGGYNAELPVFVDDAGVGNVSLGKPLNLMVSEGHHSVKVCVGILCENETVEIRFAQPVYVDFGERLKKVAEFSIPTVRIVGTRRTGDRVAVDVEFMNPGKNDLTMSATIQLAYSYIDPKSHWRQGNTKQGTVTLSVKAGTRTVQSLDLALTGGSAYIIEIPVILITSSK